MSTGVRLSVTGLGMVSSLGLEAPSACAAAFAGLTRPTPMPGVDVFDPEAGEGIDLAVYAVPMVTEGFVDVARFARLGVAALEDVTRRAEIPNDGKTGICIALPSGYHLRRHEQALALEDDDPPAEPYDIEADIRLEALRAHLIPTIRRFSDVSLHPSPGVTTFQDEAGFGALLQTVARALEGGSISRCLVGGIDSSLDPDTIGALQSAGVLLTPENAAGVMPGEAAAFVLVERATDTADGLVLEGVAQAQGIPFVPGAHERPAGVALSKSLAATRAATSRTVDTLYTSLNGTAHRAFDWGCAQVRLSADGPFEPTTVHPATSFGDIGAATGPLSVCLADHARRRGWGPPTSAVCLSSDSGLRSSFALSA